MSMEINRKTILIVDDNMSNLTTGKNLLKLRHRVFPVPSAARMFEILGQVAPDLILLDIDMPEMNGYEAIQRLKADRRYAEIPVIFLTSKSDEQSEMKGLALGAMDYVFKPFSPPLLLKRIDNQLLIAQQRITLQRHAEELLEMTAKKDMEVYSLQNAIISAMANLVERREEYNGDHLWRVQQFFKALLEGLVRHQFYADEISEWNLELILPSVQLYDIGKIGIPESILNKPGPLDPPETEIMKTHVGIGLEILGKLKRDAAESGFLDHAINMAAAHHEKWDGSGYPNGLLGPEIPLEARILAIAEVYDELLSRRPFKKAYTREKAKEIIMSCAGTHFDPILTKIFTYVQGELYQVPV
jgi:putative two-component system response regulator